MSSRSRRVTGAVLGLAAGLLYGGMAASINPLSMGDIPLRVDVTAMIADTILLGLGGACIGCLAAWPESTFKGVVGSAILMTTFGVLRGTFSGMESGDDFLRAALIIVSTFLPAVALALPVSGALRLGTNQHLEALQHSGRPRLFRLGRLYAGLCLLALLAGGLGRMSQAEADVLRKVNRMLQNGLAAQSEADVPRPLQRIADFHARAQGEYTLDYSVDQSADTSIAGSAGVQTIIVDVLFENGLHFDCMAGQSLAEPLCTEK